MSQDGSGAIRPDKSRQKELERWKKELEERLREEAYEQARWEERNRPGERQEDVEREGDD